MTCKEFGRPAEIIHDLQICILRGLTTTTSSAAVPKRETWARSSAPAKPFNGVKQSPEFRCVGKGLLVVDADEGPGHGYLLAKAPLWDQLK